MDACFARSELAALAEACFACWDSRTKLAVLDETSSYASKDNFLAVRQELSARRMPSCLISVGTHACRSQATMAMAC